MMVEFSGTVHRYSDQRGANHELCVYDSVETVMQPVAF